VSACKSVCVGCPLGCPLVFDHILRAHLASMEQQSQPSARRSRGTARP
jgi:hypothetical protein